MRLRLILSILIVFTLAASLAAQTKTSGTLQCAKSDPQYAIPVGDRPDHVFSISKAKCTWVKPFDMAGVAAKDYEYTAFNDISGSRARSRSVGIGTMANGDRCFVASQGSGTVKEGVAQTVEGTWTYTGGTGKLKGVKGKGTFKGKLAPDGTSTSEVEGEYQLPK
jgi:hypothetical protein